MDEVQQLFELNWSEIIIGILVIIVATIFIWEKGSWLIGKIASIFKEKERLAVDHEAIQNLSSAVNKISESQDGIISTINKTEKTMNEIKLDVDLLKTESASAKIADQQVMQDRLFQCCRYYINTAHGIPEDEVESFTNMYKSYVERGDGNEGLNAKVAYCLEKLDVIPANENYVIKKDSPLAGKIFMQE